MNDCVESQPCAAATPVLLYMLPQRQQLHTHLLNPEQTLPLLLIFVVTDYFKLSYAILPSTRSQCSSIPQYSLEAPL